MARRVVRRAVKRVVRSLVWSFRVTLLTRRIRELVAQVLSVI